MVGVSAQAIHRVVLAVGRAGRQTVLAMGRQECQSLQELKPEAAKMSVPPATKESDRPRGRGDTGLVLSGAVLLGVGEAVGR